VIAIFDAAIRLTSGMTIYHTFAFFNHVLEWVNVSSCFGRNIVQTPQALATWTGSSIKDALDLAGLHNDTPLDVPPLSRFRKINPFFKHPDYLLIPKPIHLPAIGALPGDVVAGHAPHIFIHAVLTDGEAATACPAEPEGLAAAMALLFTWSALSAGSSFLGSLD
jgi:hypothetical protein